MSVVISFSFEKLNTLRKASKRTKAITRIIDNIFSFLLLGINTEKASQSNNDSKIPVVDVDRNMARLIIIANTYFPRLIAKNNSGSINHTKADGSENSDEGLNEEIVHCLAISEDIGKIEIGETGFCNPYAINDWNTIPAKTGAATIVQLLYN